MKCKVDSMKFFAIKSFSRTHSNAETAKEFGVSVATVSQCKRFNTLDEYRKYGAEMRRQNYLARKEKIKGNGLHFEPPKKPIDGTGGKTAAGDPFGDAVKPKPITPLGAQKAPIQDGPMTTHKMEEEPHKILPMTHEQYRKAYSEQEIEIGKLKGKLAKAEMEKADLQSRYEGLKTLYDNLRGEYKTKSERLEALTLAQKPVKALNNVVSIPENTGAPTEIEITVGDAVIKVSTKGK